MKNQLSHTHLTRSLPKFINLWVILILLLSVVVTVNAVQATTSPFFQTTNNLDRHPASDGYLDPNLGTNMVADTDTINVPNDGGCETNEILVGCWKMEGYQNTNILVDNSSKGNHAIAYGYTLPSLVAGRVDTYALRLNGGSQYAAIPDNNSLDLETGLTLAAWIRPEIYKTQDLIKKAVFTYAVPAEGLSGYELALEGTIDDVPMLSQKVFFRINQAYYGDIYRINSNSAYPLNTWIHVAATYYVSTDPGNSTSPMCLYINGVLQDCMDATTIKTNIHPLTIGSPFTSLNFQGSIDDVRVYNIALTATEVAELYAYTPTAVTMSTFSAAKAPAGVQLAWETVSETSTAGFNLYRRETSGSFVLVNPTLIPPQALGQLQGASYTYIDTGALPGRRYEYKLEAIDTLMNVSSTTLLTYWPYTIMLPLLVN